MAFQGGGYSSSTYTGYGNTQSYSSTGYSPVAGDTYGSQGTYGSSPGTYGSSPGTYGSQGTYYSQGQYAESATSQSQGTSLYQPLGSYGAVGEPVKPLGNEKAQTSPSYETGLNRFNSSQDESYGSYGNNTEPYGGGYGQTYDNTGDTYSNLMNNLSSQESNSYSYGNGAPSYGPDYNQREGGRPNRGERGGNRGGNRGGYRGGNEMFRGRGRGRGNFDSGFTSGNWRGTRARGRGQFNGMRGRGQSNGMRGRGQQDGSRGRGQQDRSRGRGRGRGRGSDQGYNTEWKSYNKGGNIKQQSSKVALEGDNNFISYKNSLQEYCQKHHKPVPQYIVDKAEVGFSASVVVDGVTYPCEVSQRERKYAELGAAFEALKGLGFISAVVKYSPKGKKRSSVSNDISSPKTKALKSETDFNTVSVPSVSYKCKLNEACQKMKIDCPSYNTVRTSGGFVCTVVLNGQVYESAKPCGNKKLAEQNAAEVVLSQVDYLNIVAAAATAEQTSAENNSNAVITPITNTPSTTTDSNVIASASWLDTATDTPLSGESGSVKRVASKSMKNIVQEHCQKNGMPIPTYTTIKDSGMNISTINVNGTDYVGTPHIMKKTAEQNAAKKAVEELALK